MNSSDARLPPALVAAIGHVKATAARVAEKVATSLGNQAHTAVRILERDLLLATQIELRRKMNTFHLSFGKLITDKVLEEIRPRLDTRRRVEDWQTLSLVEDSEVEERMFSDRIAQQITHTCEWELREMAAYMGSVLHLGRADEERNPLRAEVIGLALFRAIETLTTDSQSRKLLAREFGLGMGAAMPDCYAGIVREMQQRDVQPVGLALKTVEGPGNLLPGVNSGYATLRDETHPSRSGASDYHGPTGTDFGGGPRYAGGGSPRGGAGGPASNLGGGYDRAGGSGYDMRPPGGGGYERSPAATGGYVTRSGGGGYGGEQLDRGSYGGGGGGHGPGHSSPYEGGGNSGYGSGAGPGSGAGYPGGHGNASGGHPGGYPGGHAPYSGSYGVGEQGAGYEGGTGRGAPGSLQSDGELMTLLRRLAHLPSRSGALDAASAGGVPGFDRSTGGGLHPHAGGHHGEAMSGLMAVNLIRAHREELIQASRGKLDHMVIDIVGSLFDQILSDSRVHPQVARQIARLQLPVLRVALVDSSFFSSRRHPVRRFVNRIASLSCGFENFDEGPGKEFIDRVRELVQEIVDGDFDQLDIYTAKLTAIENFITGQTETETKQSGAAAVLESKESELRIHQRYTLQLRSALSGITMPDYLRDFVTQVWSQALVHATRRMGPDSDLARRFRHAGRDLIMSVQPKGSPTLRKRFLMLLPALMKDLNEGLKLIGWPESAQKEFLAKLLPSHADSLKAPPMTELDHNLLAKQIEAIFHGGIPGAHEFSTAEPVAMESEQIEQRFSPEEVKKVGLVEESAVDWSKPVDIDLGAELIASKPFIPAGAAAAAPLLEDAVDAHASSTPSAATATDVTPFPVIDTSGDDETAPLDLGVDIKLELGTPDPSEPTQGPGLMEHIKLGFAYQMLLKDQWQKVRLNYVSPGRNFFVFTHGGKHQETISLTSRMLARMCESNRMRAVENAYLMERATARARKQLAALKTTAAAKH